MRRDDTYESIRQMIDEIDSFRNIMIVYGFDRELMDHDSDGFKSYQALWMRIQNEIVGERFNKFNDIVNLDKLGSEIYTPDMLVQMSEKMAGYGNTLSGRSYLPISRQTAEKLISKAQFGALGLPLLVLQETLGEGTETEREETR